ncbi:MAG: crossover junction endodeoxyribonuclease RuvC [Parachlamydiaceae bacterium]|nr:crossover junction endodeoxyribonuclease RuvC [Parachlamydiaceae bacterium]
MSDQKKSRRILGIDPGTRISGYGIIDVESHRYVPIDYGCIRPPGKLLLSDRYLVIFNGVEELIKKYQPDAIVVETQFVHKNIQSAIKLGMARGVVLIAAKNNGLPIFEYAPTKAKMSVVGTGRASKFQVQSMIQRLLNLSSVPEPEDAADALALAICHAHTAEHLIHNYEI